MVNREYVVKDRAMSRRDKVHLSSEAYSATGAAAVRERRSAAANPSFQRASWQTPGRQRPADVSVVLASPAVAAGQPRVVAAGSDQDGTIALSLVPLGAHEPARPVNVMKPCP